MTNKRSLDNLSRFFRPWAVEFLIRLMEEGVYVKVVSTLRTPEEQVELIRKGVSWTAASKHLDGMARGKTYSGSDAIDICPFAIQDDAVLLKKLEWNADHTSWTKVGVVAHELIREAAEKYVTLRWGGDWKVKDYGHLELSNQ